MIGAYEAVSLRRFTTRVRSLEELWAHDKALLSRQRSGLRIGERALPLQQDMHALLLLRQNMWQSPQNPIEPTQSSLETMAATLGNELEHAWGMRFESPLDVELAQPDDYIERTNELLRETAQRVGYGAQLETPPRASQHPLHGRLVVPSKFFMVRREGAGYKWDLIPWDCDYLEETLVEALASALFRQARGEWREKYVDAAKAVGERDLHKIRGMLAATEQYGVERLLDAHPQWTIYALANKASGVWSNAVGMNNYRGVATLAADRSLAQIAMLDATIILPDSDREMLVGFLPEHPYHRVKEKLFFEKGPERPV